MNGSFCTPEKGTSHTSHLNQTCNNLPIIHAPRQETQDSSVSSYPGKGEGSWCGFPLGFPGTREVTAGAPVSPIGAQRELKLQVKLPRIWSHRKQVKRLTRAP